MSDIRQFLKAPSRAQPRAAAAKGKPEADGRGVDLPADIDGHPLPAALQALVDAQQGNEERAIWLIPRVLSLGEPPQARVDPRAWIQERGLRVVVDCSLFMDEAERHAQTIARSGAVLVRVPLKTDAKTDTATNTTLMCAGRVLMDVIAANLVALSYGQPPVSVHLCDTYNGTIAATLAAPLLALHLRVSLLDACVAISRMWRHNTVAGRSVSGARRLPQGKWLKQSVLTLFERLRERPLGASSTRSLLTGLVAKAAVLGVDHSVPAALALLDFDQRLLPLPLLFNRNDSTRALTWCMHNNTYKEADAFARLDDLVKEREHRSADDGDTAVPKRRRYRRTDSDSDEDDQRDSCMW